MSYSEIVEVLGICLSGNLWPISSPPAAQSWPICNGRHEAAIDHERMLALNWHELNTRDTIQTRTRNNVQCLERMSGNNL